MQPPPAPMVQFNQEHYHHLVKSDKRSTFKVPIQREDTFYNCVVCGIHTLYVSGALLSEIPHIERLPF